MEFTDEVPQTQGWE